EVTEDAGKIRDFRRLSSKLGKAVRRRDGYVVELRASRSCDDPIGNIKMLSHMQLNDMEKAARLLLMVRDTQIKMDEKTSFIMRMRNRKSKRKSFHSKLTPSLKKWLHLLHMDLCGPMRVASINGKRYVLVIVDDYSRYAWTHFLRSKDETPEVLIDFLRLVQRGLQAQVRVAEAIATACFTQNRSLVIPRHEKTPYHIINDQKLSVKFFHIFGFVCYIVKDRENLDKMKEKGDECIFVGYSTQSRAYKVFNKRTRVIMESIHVNFDELPQMASAHSSSDPAPTCQTMASVQISSDPAPECQTMALEHDSLSTTSNELDLLFSLMFDELLNGLSKVLSKSSVVSAADAVNEHDEFINIFSTPVQDQGETSSR
nr:hypothetical protein [Tanacetum cinerariifolium]